MCCRRAVTSGAAVLFAIVRRAARVAAVAGAVMAKTVVAETGLANTGLAKSGLASAVMAAVIGLAAAQTPPSGRLTTVWDLRLGAPVTEQPGRDAFRGFACGSGGGAPRAPLESFAGFRRCAPESGGLREVYFEYDDELEYIARAHDDERAIARFAGTQEQGFPVIVSALIDEAGVVRGIRMVTDPRPEHRNDVIEADRRKREEAHMLASVMASRFDIDPARDCRTIPPAAGETAVGDLFIKTVCERTRDGRRIVVGASFFRKPGQSGYDPREGGELTRGQFESSGRLEIVQLP